MTFVAEDDVWLAPLDGGRAWRVSADNMPVTLPRISPDGTALAWTSTRDGAPEVHLAPVAGGPAERLTHWGNRRTEVRGWTPDGQVLALSAQGRPSTDRTWAHAVPLDGGPAAVLPYGPVGDVAFGPATVLLSAPMGREAAYWKRYRGGTAGKLWIDRAGDGAFERLHAELDGNIECPVWAGDRLAFLCDHEGTGALYSSLADGSDLRRHTPIDGFYARHAAGDGTRVVYSSAGELWLLDDLEGGEPRRLEVRLGGPRLDLRPYPVNAARWFGAAAPDHTARGSAVCVRGGVHWVTHRSGPARALAATPGVRARRPRTFRAEGEEWVVWVTDAEGDDALEFAPATGLLLVERETGEVREVDRSDDGEVSGLAFSPDSGWLAWTHPGPRPLSQLRLAHTTDLSVTEATPLRFQDYAPAFTLDGKHLAFLSNRAFDPVYDEHVFDLAFVVGARPHLITLAATTPSPFGPQRHGRPFEAPDKDETPDSEGTPVTRIDLDGLADRIVPFPVEAGRYSGLRAAKDGVLWLRHPVHGVLGASRAQPEDPGPHSELERYDLAQRRLEHLAADADHFEVSGDGKRVLLWSDGRLRVVPSDRRTGSDDDGDSSVTVDLARVRQTVEPAAEWRQMYDEAGRLMRDHFWRPDLHGVDWDGVLDRYRPLLDRLATHSDLVDLLWEVHGELGTSHAYVSPSGGAGGAPRQGLLGADISRHEDGSWRIDRILPAETSDPDARSPLAAPGVAVRPGDAVVAVAGHPVDPVRGPGPLLVGTAGQPVELTVAPADGGEPRHTVVVPLADEGPLRYHAWVADRRAHVHQASGGRLGYLHVPDMQAPGWAQIHRDLRVEVTREGLVVDVRENRGGHTSQLVVEKLARRIISRVACGPPAIRWTHRGARSSPSPTSSPAPTATSSTRRSRPSASARSSAPAPGAG